MLAQIVIADDLSLPLFHQVFNAIILHLPSTLRKLVVIAPSIVSAPMTFELLGPSIDTIHQVLEFTPVRKVLLAALRRS